MLVSLLVLFMLEAAMLGATILRIRQNKVLFENIMTTVLILVYLTTLVMYIPLFITVMNRLSAMFPQVYSQVKTKGYLAFFSLWILLLIRLAIYCSLELQGFNIFNVSNVRTYIPFYLSELIISIIYIVFLIRVYKNVEQD